MTVNEFLNTVTNQKQIYLFFADEHPVGPLYSRDRVLERHNVEIDETYEKDNIIYINTTNNA